MTNEELAEAIQQGNSDLIPQLWEQVEGLVRWKANRVLSALGDNPIVDFDDLYQTGFIAMIKATKKYNPENGAFSTWFMFYLRTAFIEETGYRTVRQRKDPIHSIISLDAPLSDSDEAGTLQDLIASEENIEDTVIGSVWRKQLHAAMQAALETLEKRQAEVLRLEFYEGKSPQQIGATLGIDIEAVKREKTKAINSLRGNPIAIRYLQPFYEKTKQQQTMPLTNLAEALAARRNRFIGKK